MMRSPGVLRVNLHVQFVLQDLVRGPLTGVIDPFHDQALQMLTVTRGTPDDSFVKTVSHQSVKM